MLGLYDEAGLLHHVGFTSAIPAKERPALTKELEGLIEAPGFTGDAPQTRAEILQHRLFQDIRVRVFAKQSSTTWVELLAFDVPRTLIK